MTNDKIQMSNEAQNPNDKNKKYDLAERTAKFGEDIINFVKKLPRNEINKPLINQIVRAGTSIGANYMEADCADSKKDFRYKISLCKKESKESTHWLRMIAKANPQNKQEARVLWKEAQEFTLIFSSIINSSKSNNKV
jgi:four helix bundle protein